MKRRTLIKLLILSLSFLNHVNPTYALSNLVPKVGQKAPNFRLKGIDLSDTSKKEWELNLLTDRWILIYFFPRDFTQGCTIEAKRFQSLKSDFLKNNTKIIGISADTIGEHKSFCGDQNLEFPLLSDIGGDVSSSYGSWDPPYSIRNSFLIDQNGIIRYRWIGVKPSRHAQEVLNTILKLEAQQNLQRL